MRTVPLHGEKAAGRVALVDDEDYALVMAYRWVVSEHAAGRKKKYGPYALARSYRGGQQFTILMHKLITGWPQTDHEDHNGLNNQRSNLRPASNSQNAANSRKRARASSPYKGVSWHAASQQWLSRIYGHGKQRYLGGFAEETDAARAYDAAARELYGDYASLNFPEDSA